MDQSSWWGRHKASVLDAFVLSNFAFLILDVYLAHLVNRFRHPAEWIPVGFSVVAVLVLAPAFLLRVRGRGQAFARHAGVAVGYASIAVGLAGVGYHLDSQFFSQWTIRSLVYTVPFAAPVAYAGLGFLLVVDRTVPSGDAAWSQSVVFFALGGFLGNFVLTLCDHAMNGFFHATEWLPVFASALAVGFLGVALVERHRSFLRASGSPGSPGRDRGRGVLSPSRRRHQRPVVQPVREFRPRRPVFAPLLFVDLVLLAMIGLWDMLSDGPRHATAP